MKCQRFKTQEGFIALISIVLIFSALIILVSVVSISGFYARFNVLDYENKKVSMALAEACGETTLVNLAKDPSYQPTSPNGDSVPVGSNSCKICSPITGSPPSGPFTIITRAVYPTSGSSKAYTNLTINGTLTATNFTINSWDEFSNYTGSCTLP